MESEKEELITTLKAHLVANGWQHDAAEVVVDQIVDSFGPGSLTGEISYQDIAVNSGFPDTPPLDDQVIEMLDRIRAMT